MQTHEQEMPLPSVTDQIISTTIEELRELAASTLIPLHQQMFAILAGVTGNEEVIWQKREILKQFYSDHEIPVDRVDQLIAKNPDDIQLQEIKGMANKISAYEEEQREIWQTLPARLASCQLDGKQINWEKASYQPYCDKTTILNNVAYFSLKYSQLIYEWPDAPLEYCQVLLKEFLMFQKNDETDQEQLPPATEIETKFPLITSWTDGAKFFSQRNASTAPLSDTNSSTSKTVCPS